MSKYLLFFHYSKLSFRRSKFNSIYFYSFLGKLNSIKQIHISVKHGMDLDFRTETLFKLCFFFFFFLYIYHNMTRLAILLLLQMWCFPLFFQSQDCRARPETSCTEALLFLPPQESVGFCIKQREAWVSFSLFNDTFRGVLHVHWNSEWGKN